MEDIPTSIRNDTRKVLASVHNADPNPNIVNGFVSNVDGSSSTALKIITDLAEGDSPAEYGFEISFLFWHMRKASRDTSHTSLKWNPGIMSISAWIFMGVKSQTSPKLIQQPIQTFQVPCREVSHADNGD